MSAVSGYILNKEIVLLTTVRIASLGLVKGVSAAFDCCIDLGVIGRPDYPREGDFLRPVTEVEEDFFGDRGASGRRSLFPRRSLLDNTLADVAVDATVRSFDVVGDTVALVEVVRVDPGSWFLVRQ